MSSLYDTIACHYMHYFPVVLWISMRCSKHCWMSRFRASRVGCLLEHNNAPAELQSVLYMAGTIHQLYQPKNGMFRIPEDVFSKHVQYRKRPHADRPKTVTEALGLIKPSPDLTCPNADRQTIAEARDCPIRTLNSRRPGWICPN